MTLGFIPRNLKIFIFKPKFLFSRGEMIAQTEKFLRIQLNEFDEIDVHVRVALIQDRINLF